MSGTHDRAAALAEFERRVAREASGLRIVAAGHRVAHGDARFTAPALVTDALLARFRAA